MADLVFDVGMHKGEDSSFYLAKGYRVVGFEANPELAASCQRRFASEILEGRMTIIEGAISDSAAATVRFLQASEHSVGNHRDGLGRAQSRSGGQ